MNRTASAKSPLIMIYCMETRIRRKGNAEFKNADTLFGFLLERMGQDKMCTWRDKCSAKYIKKNK